MVGRPCGQVRGEAQFSRSDNRLRCSSGVSAFPAFTAILLQTRPAILASISSCSGASSSSKSSTTARTASPGSRPRKQSRHGAHLEAVSARTVRSGIPNVPAPATALPTARAGSRQVHDRRGKQSTGRGRFSGRVGPLTSGIRPSHGRHADRSGTVHPALRPPDMVAPICPISLKKGTVLTGKVTGRTGSQIFARHWKRAGASNSASLPRPVPETSRPGQHCAPRAQATSPRQLTEPGYMPVRLAV